MTDTTRLKADLQTLQRAYAMVFGREGERGEAVAIVMRDLALEGHAHHSTFDPDGRIHARREGRRDMWLHIQELLNIPHQELWGRYRKQLEFQQPAAPADEERF